MDAADTEAAPPLGTEADAPSAAVVDTTPCVPVKDIVKQEGALHLEPAAVGFGEVAPGDLQGNVVSMRMSNTGTTPISVAAISCTPLEGAEAVTSTFFVMHFGSGTDAQRVQCAPARHCHLNCNAVLASAKPCFRVLSSTENAAACSGQAVSLCWWRVQACRCSTPGDQAPVEPAFTIPAGQDRVATALFEPTELLEAVVTLTLHGVDGALGSVVATGTGGDPWAKAHTLHPVIDGDTIFAEPDAAGGAVVLSAALLSFVPYDACKFCTIPRCLVQLCSTELMNQREHPQCKAPRAVISGLLRAEPDIVLRHVQQQASLCSMMRVQQWMRL